MQLQNRLAELIWRLWSRQFPLPKTARHSNFQSKTKRKSIFDIQITVIWNLFVKHLTSKLECFETFEIEIRIFWNIFNKALFTWHKNGKQRLYWQIQIKLYFKLFYTVCQWLEISTTHPPSLTVTLRHEKPEEPPTPLAWRNYWTAPYHIFHHSRSTSKFLWTHMRMQWFNPILKLTCLRYYTRRVNSFYRVEFYQGSGPGHSIEHTSLKQVKSSQIMLLNRTCNKNIHTLEISTT